MATIKSFTDLSQSKTLSTILPPESADMHWSKDFDGSWFVDLAEYASVKIPKYVVNVEEHVLPCWSLAALLKALPRYLEYYGVECPLRLYTFDFENPHVKSHCWVAIYEDYDEEHERYNFKVEVRGNEIIDVCYEMVLKLKELKKL